MSYKIEQLLEAISFSLERSASAAEATHKLYKRANEMTERHMQAREEREREQSERAKEDFSMAKERHEAFMRREKLAADKEEALLKAFQRKEGEGGNIISVSPNSNK